MVKASLQAKIEKALSKPKTRKGKKIQEEREGKVVENDKKVLLLRGPQTGEKVNELLKDLHACMKPLAAHFSRQEKDLVDPMQNAVASQRLEDLSRRTDSSLVLMGSKTKKRPFRLCFARMFASQIMDMQEMDVESFTSASSFSGVSKPVLGSKPLVLFQGAGFDQGSCPQLSRMKSLLLDFFRGASPKQVFLEGIDRIWVFSAVERKNPKLKREGEEGEANKYLVTARHYKVTFKRTGTKLPFVHLDEIGPSFDFSASREKVPDHDLWKAATRPPKPQAIAPTETDTPKPKKKAQNKNITTDELGFKRGRIHLGRQNFDRINTHLAGKTGAAKAKKVIKK